MKVVDASCDVAGRFAAKLFAMGGADVVRLASAETPEADGSVDVLSAYLDKHKTVLRWQGPGTTPASLADADVLFTSYDQGRRLGLASELLSLLPRAVHVTTSTFGMTGPYAGFRGGPAATWAASGYLAITGDPGREPLMGPEHLCGYISGYTAALAAEAGLRQRRRSGLGQRIDISSIESMLSVHQMTFPRAAVGQDQLRAGRYAEPGFYPLVVRPCGRGYVSLGIVLDAHFDRLAVAIGRPELAADPRFEDAASRWAHRDALDSELDLFLRQQDAVEVAELLQAHGVPASAVVDPLQNRTNPQLVHRDFWVGADRAAGGFMPGNPLPPAKLVPAQAGNSAGGNIADWDTARRSQAPLPLAGIKVLDLGAYWSGPTATRSLADLGAHVIRIERHYPGGDRPTNSAGIVRELHQWNMNRLKRSVVLDMQSAEGRAAARDLALEADVLLENFSPGVTDRLGIGPQELCAANPTLVYVSLSGYGHAGPWRDWRSFGPNIEAASSLLARNGYLGGEPLRMGQTLPDGVGGVAGTLTALRGLRQRDETGRGGWYDVAQLEVYAALSGEEVLAASLEGAWAGRFGNRSRLGAIRGVFPCRGDDQWIVIRLSEADDVSRFVAATGLTGFADAAGAPRDDDAVEAMIAAYTREHDKAELTDALQAAGIEALPVLTATELMADRHLRARSFFKPLRVGDRDFAMPGHPFHADEPLADCEGVWPRF